MPGVLCDKRVPPHVKGKLHKKIVQPAMQYEMERVPVTTVYTPREETGSDRNENVQMGMRPHAKRQCEKRTHQGETGGSVYRLRWICHV